jgi:hypothetical protein
MLLSSHTYKYTPVHRPRSCRKNTSAIIWTGIDSLVAHTRPFIARAASKLRCDVAKACHMQVNIISTENIRLIARRPKILLNGTMMKFAKPHVMIVIPVSIESWLSFKCNSCPSKGYMGAIESAPVTDIHVKSHWLAITITGFRVSFCPQC